MSEEAAKYTIVEGKEFLTAGREYLAISEAVKLEKRLSDFVAQA
ncbi:MAG: hypothetical protein WA990_10715 [Rubrobacteraceae bacterium]